MITELEVEAKDSGKIAVPAKILMETLRRLPEQPVTFSIDEDTNAIEISSDNGHYKLSGENAADFPKIPEISGGYSVDISSDALASAIANTIFATSNDELRPAMTGVHIILGEAKYYLCCHRWPSANSIPQDDVASDEEHAIIIPRKALNLLKTTFPGKLQRNN